MALKDIIQRSLDEHYGGHASADMIGPLARRIATDLAPHIKTLQALSYADGVDAALGDGA